jgi:hypothetical protein
MTVNKLDGAKVEYAGEDKHGDHWICATCDEGTMDEFFDTISAELKGKVGKQFINPMRAFFDSDTVMLRVARAPHFEIVENRRDAKDKHTIYVRQAQTHSSTPKPIQDVIHEALADTETEKKLCDVDVVLATCYESNEVNSATIVCSQLHVYSIEKTPEDANNVFVNITKNENETNESYVQ